MSTIFICDHCGEKASEGKRCKNCSTAEDRRAMCKANKENNPNYECKICGIERNELN